MNFTIPLYERRENGEVYCATLGLGPMSQAREGRNLHKVHAGIMDSLRPLLAKAKARELRRMSMARGMRIERVRMDLTLSRGGERRKVTGVYPIVIEPRWASQDGPITFAYPPMPQEDASGVRPDRTTGMNGFEELQGAPTGEQQPPCLAIGATSPGPRTRAGRAAGSSGW